MKAWGIKFLVKANLKGSSKKISIAVLVILLVVAMTIIPSYVGVALDCVSVYRQAYRSHALQIDPSLRKIDDEAIAEIMAVDHVTDITEAPQDLYGGFKIENITGDSKLAKEASENYCDLGLYGLLENEKPQIVAGIGLDSAPKFTCIVPERFYPDFEANEYEDMLDLPYCDGKQFVGETISVTHFNGEYSISYNIDFGDDIGWGQISPYSKEVFDLKIVGTYKDEPAGFGLHNAIYVSKDTMNQITENVLKASNYDLNDKNDYVAQWWNDSSLHQYDVIIDDFENAEEVSDKILSLGIYCEREPELTLSEQVKLLSGFLGSFGIFLTAALAILAAIMLINYSVNNIRSRKSEIGFMKATGYKDGQILLCMYLEQLFITLSSFAAGAVISATVVGILNHHFAHSIYNSLMYLVPWQSYLIYIAAALVFVTAVPLLSQLVVMKKLSKIQPKDAMTA